MLWCVSVLRNATYELNTSGTVLSLSARVNILQSGSTCLSFRGLILLSTDFENNPEMIAAAIVAAVDAGYPFLISSSINQGLLIRLLYPPFSGIPPSSAWTIGAIMAVAESITNSVAITATAGLLLFRMNM